MIASSIFDPLKFCAVLEKKVQFLGHIQAKVAFSQGDWPDLDSSEKFWTKNMISQADICTYAHVHTHARARAKIILREVSIRKVSRKRRGKRRGAVQYSTTTTTTTYKLWFWVYQEARKSIFDLWAFKKNQFPAWIADLTTILQTEVKNATFFFKKI